MNVVVKYCKSCFLIILLPMNLLLNLLFYPLKTMRNNYFSKTNLHPINQSRTDVKNIHLDGVIVNECKESEQLNRIESTTSAAHNVSQFTSFKEQIFFPNFIDQGKLKPSNIGERARFLPDTPREGNQKQEQNDSIKTENDCKGIEDLDESSLRELVNYWMNSWPLPKEYPVLLRQESPEIRYAMPNEVSKKLLLRRTKNNQNYSDGESELTNSASTDSHTEKEQENRTHLCGINSSDIKEDGKYGELQFSSTSLTVDGNKYESYSDKCNKEVNETVKRNVSPSLAMLNEIVIPKTPEELFGGSTDKVDRLKELVLEINEITAGKNLLLIRNNKLILNDRFTQLPEKNSENRSARRSSTSGSDTLSSEDSLELTIDDKNEDTEEYSLSRECAMFYDACSSGNNVLSARNVPVKLSKNPGISCAVSRGIEGRAIDRKLSRHHRRNGSRRQSFAPGSSCGCGILETNFAASNNNYGSINSDSVFTDDVLLHEGSKEKEKIEITSTPENVYEQKSSISLFPKDLFHHESNNRISSSVERSQRDLVSSFESESMSLSSFRSRPPFYLQKSSSEGINDNPDCKDLENSLENSKHALSEFEEWTQVAEDCGKDSNEEYMDSVISFNTSRERVEDLNSRSFYMSRDDARLLAKPKSKSGDLSASFIEFRQKAESSARRWYMKRNKPNIKLSVRKFCSRFNF